MQKLYKKIVEKIEQKLCKKMFKNYLENCAMNSAKIVEIIMCKNLDEILNFVFFSFVNFCNVSCEIIPWNNLTRFPNSLFRDILEYVNFNAPKRTYKHSEHINCWILAFRNWPVCHIFRKKWGKIIIHIHSELTFWFNRS